MALAVLALCLACCTPVARGASLAEEQWEAYGVPSVEEAAGDVVEQPLTVDIDLWQGISDLLEAGGDALAGAVKGALRSGFLQLAVVLFAGVAGGLGNGLSQEVRGGIHLVASLSVTGLAVADAGSMIGLGRETIGELNGFAQILIPVMTTVSAAAGNPTGATARQAAALLCSDLLITLIDRVLVPFVYLYLAAAAAAHIAGNGGLSAVAKLLHWGVSTMLTTVLVAYTGLLSFLSISAAGTDALASRLTRTAISGLVPVVGGILSDATDTILAGAGLVRSAVGIFGVLAVLGFCLTPFLRLGVQYLMYRLVSVLSAVLWDGGLDQLLGEIGSAFGLMLGMTGAAALLLLIALFAAMSAALPT